MDTTFLPSAAFAPPLPKNLGSSPSHPSALCRTLPAQLAGGVVLSWGGTITHTALRRTLSPPSIKVHRTFHVSKIKPEHTSNLNLMMDGSPVHSAHHLLHSRCWGRGFQYLVDWEYSGSEDRSLILDFNATHPDQPRPTERTPIHPTPSTHNLHHLWPDNHPAPGQTTTPPRTTRSLLPPQPRRSMSPFTTSPTHCLPPPAFRTLGTPTIEQFCNSRNLVVTHFYWAGAAHLSHITSSRTFPPYHSPTCTRLMKLCLQFPASHSVPTVNWTMKGMLWIHGQNGFSVVVAALLDAQFHKIHYLFIPINNNKHSVKT